MLNAYGAAFNTHSKTPSQVQFFYRSVIVWRCFTAGKAFHVHLDHLECGGRSICVSPYHSCLVVVPLLPLKGPPIKQPILVTPRRSKQTRSHHMCRFCSPHPLPLFYISMHFFHSPPAPPPLLSTPLFSLTPSAYTPPFSPTAFPYLPSSFILPPPPIPSLSPYSSPLPPPFPWPLPIPTPLFSLTPFHDPPPLSPTYPLPRPPPPPSISPIAKLRNSPEGTLSGTRAWWPSTTTTTSGFSTSIQRWEGNRHKSKRNKTAW